MGLIARGSMAFFSILASIPVICNASCSPNQPFSSPRILVAHAGGAWQGDNYQNSIEALEHNYRRGFRFFELDFSWTSDRALVAIHDWDGTYRRLFKSSSGIPDLATFSSQKMKRGTTAITLDRLAIWLRDHSEAWIISDIKAENLAGLEWMVERFPAVAKRTLPQIYAPGEYQRVRELGYENVILTLYRLPDSANDAVLALARSSPLLAVAMPVHRLDQRSLVDGLLTLNIPICIHTINEVDIWTALQGRGASCIYTDLISPIEVATGAGRDP